MGVATSKFEINCREFIGGGEKNSFKSDISQVRVGGSAVDAQKVIMSAQPITNDVGLRSRFTHEEARACWRLPHSFKVSSLDDAVCLSNYNDEANAGPSLRSFGIKKKYGSYTMLQEFYREILEIMSGHTRLREQGMPFLCDVGTRTKLRHYKDVEERFENNKPVGRMVSMIDASDQFMTNGFLRAFNKLSGDVAGDPYHPVKNKVCRQSSDWATLGRFMSLNDWVFQGDYSQYDANISDDDLLFVIETMKTCFQPTNVDEENLLDLYFSNIRNSLIDKVFLTKDNLLFTMQHGLPSGCLGTSIIGTLTNILYLHSGMKAIGLDKNQFTVWCAGDDFVAMGRGDLGEVKAQEFRKYLNENHNAKIEPEEFKYFEGSFTVVKQQATFPPGTDLSHGTSQLLDIAVWVDIVDDYVHNDAQGLSHRTRYNCQDYPKFLNFGWTCNFEPIRSTHESLLKLLHPEGIHKDVDTYMQAIMGFAVDNPYNDNLINKLLHRWLICRQVQFYESIGFTMAELLTIAEERTSEPDVCIPVPQFVYWRRFYGKFDIESNPITRAWAWEFKKFVRSIYPLYTRKSDGTMDTWVLTRALTSNKTIASDQIGASHREWAAAIVQLEIPTISKALKRTFGLDVDVVKVFEQYDEFRAYRSFFLNFLRSIDDISSLSYGHAVLAYRNL